MKILVVSNSPATREAFAAKIREHYPDAELIFSEDLPNPEEGHHSEAVWIDELSDFLVKRVVCPPEVSLPPTPAREKVMHPWSRRKKR